MKKGRFFVLEGSDGAGSSTQARLLQGYLEGLGRLVHMTAEPSSGPLGKNIRDFLGGSLGALKLRPHILALAFAADRLHHYEAEILPELEKGIDVISDRYMLSSLVYQGLKLSPEWVLNLNRHAPQADVSILIDASVETAAKRRNQRGGQKEIFDDTEVQRQIRNRYLELAPEFKTVVVDGDGPEKEVFKLLLKAIGEA